MNQKSFLLWIFLQCAAALFSPALGENAVLEGKKRLCVYCSLICINNFFPPASKEVWRSQPHVFKAGKYALLNLLLETNMRWKHPIPNILCGFILLVKLLIGASVAGRVSQKNGDGFKSQGCDVSFLGEQQEC